MKGQELLHANAGRFEISQLKYTNDTAIVDDTEEKSCRLVS